MSRPNLPKHTDPENNYFHPVFKAAAEEAIFSKGLAGQISVKAQYHSPTGPIDLVLFNNNTNRVLLPIEIKRTQSSVRGGGRRQARDYWQNLGAGCESQYYCVTNLELVELFRYDAAKPRTSAQRIELTNPINGYLGSTPKSAFYDQLKATIEEILDTVKGVVAFKYVTGGLTEFQANLEAKTSDPDGWHKLFIPVCFEYIRGAATQIAQLQAQADGWKSASIYKATPNRLIQLGNSIDFSHIFSEPGTDQNDTVAFANTVIKEAFEAGKALGKGDDIAELVNELLSTPSAPGIVETDTELAQLLAVVAKDALGRELLQNEEAFDPASGSGRLLTALPLTAFPSLGPSQVKANEKEKLFAEALSLRLGLAFGAVLSPTNAPAITISGIESIVPSYLKNVRLVVMNPPYLSGVQAAGIKGLFTNRIKAISGSDALLDIGQAALEILFLELVWHLVPDETVIATVFPSQHLTRLSDEVVALRRFLTNNLALTHIVIYPRQGLFESVIKQTVLLVGKKGNPLPGQHIKVVEVQTNVGDIDLGELLANLLAGSHQPTHGVVVREVLRSELYKSASEGWRRVLGAGVRANSFIKTHMAQSSTVRNLGDNVRRGVLGGSGNTALTVFSKTKPQYKSVVALIPQSWLRPVLNTTESMPRLLTPDNAPETSFMPPPSAYVDGTADNATLQKIIHEYLRVNQPRAGSQAKAKKTPQTIQRNLKSNQKEFGAGWVLIQRASRTKGEICLLEVPEIRLHADKQFSGGRYPLPPADEGLYPFLPQAGERPEMREREAQYNTLNIAHPHILLSTNVFMVRLPTELERKLFASWMLSVFGQIQLELVSAGQEGMRKLEIEAIKHVRFPDFSVIPKNIETALLANLPNEPAHSFDAIRQRPSDQLWAEVVAPSSPTLCLAQALILFQELVDERKGFGNS